MEKSERIKSIFGDIKKVLNEWGLSYNEIIAPLVQVVQDQQKTIEDLLQRIERLEQKE